MHKRVLVIAFYFPPNPEIGSIRLKGLAKFLPEFGWDPTILTPTFPSRQDRLGSFIEAPYPGDISSLFNTKLSFQKGNKPQGAAAFRLVNSGWKQSIKAKVSKLAHSILAYPDEQRRWCSIAIAAGAAELAKEKYDAILSSSSPVTAHIIASRLKSMYDVPWVADLRDLWSQNHYYSYVAPRRHLDKRLERKTLRNASALVTVSKPLSERLATLHKMPIFTIPNGFDPDEELPTSLTDKFTITYTGRLYQRKRDPGPLLMAVSELIKEGIFDPNKVKVRFYGEKVDWLESEVKLYSLEGIVEQYGVISRESSLTKQRESQLLLLLNWNDPNEIGVYTGKLFEYLAAKRPILAFGGPKGVVSDLLKETQAGVHVSDKQELKESLSGLYREYIRIGQVAYCGNDRIQKYSHIEMAKSFVRVLEDCAM